MKWGNFGWVFNSIFSRKNGGNAGAAAATEVVESDSIRNGESSSAIPPDSPLVKSYSMLKLLQMEDEQQQKTAKYLKPKKADKTLKMISFSRFVIRKLFIKTKSATTTENANNVGRIAEIVIGRQASTSIGRSPSRATTLKMARSLTKKTSRQKSERQDDRNEISTMYERGKPEREAKGEELCKKRILMGGKCKPLLGSFLGYDRDGVLKPDSGL